MRDICDNCGKVRVLNYECEDCGSQYCTKCAEDEMCMECECRPPENLVWIGKTKKK